MCAQSLIQASSKMAGRGRGRGRGRGFSFDVGVIGFKRGEALPATIQQPPPLYPAEIKSKDIERFSDRYREKKKEELEWQPDWRLFPNELKIRVKKHRNPSNARPRIGKPVKKNSVGVEALKQLEEMVQKEGNNDQANDQEEEGTEGESGEEELEYDEEEQEEPSSTRPLS
ncbi:hypothetical protein pdam_00015014 [Pocillopora damicornis]|uniref:Uncharacterized protein n=1 Tax=Pocillopora damicornis TaxID=46731 RepID=A0A3M6T5H7_POCDA|nr:hypothetical protein pdam_00015014 [Pocillopora damicornis]